MRPDWMSEAACRDTINPEAWFRGDKLPADRADTAAAVAICKTCPVAQLCLERALADEGSIGASSRFGIFGGLDPKQRMKLDRKRRGLTHPYPHFPCGTEAAYYRHSRKGEPICEQDRDAHREKSAARTVAWRARLKAGRVA
jgi:hypothetical protein